MKEPKLHKFRLIDHEGFLNKHSINEVVLGAHFVEGIVEGRIDGNGNLKVGDCPVIFPEEFKFFEEVFDTPQDESNPFWDGVGTPPDGSICEAFHPTSNTYRKVEILKSVNNRGFDFSACMCIEDYSIFWSEIIRPIKPVIWQEVLCTEFGMRYNEKEDKFIQEDLISTKDLISMAKRIIELSTQADTEVSS
ncbi:MAG: hypothetical protein GY787_21490 [Alteromonadales bacterium]|nr:hypothetical protein [Alteromonadales bacterium]